MTYGVILAGGIGSRMGGDKPKQYLTVKDKPIIIYTIEKFLVVPEFEKIIVLCPKQWVEHTKNLVEKHAAKAGDKVVVIEGGSTRNETIMNAIKFIDSEGNLNDDTIIVTHDSVRPFVTHRIIEENINKGLRKFETAKELNKSQSTIGKEIKNNRKRRYSQTEDSPWKCKHYKDCKVFSFNFFL